MLLLKQVSDFQHTIMGRFGKQEISIPLARVQLSKIIVFALIQIIQI